MKSMCCCCCMHVTFHCLFCGSKYSLSECLLSIAKWLAVTRIQNTQRKNSKSDIYSFNFKLVFIYLLFYTDLYRIRNANFEFSTKITNTHMNTIHTHVVVYSELNEIGFYLLLSTSFDTDTLQ